MPIACLLSLNYFQSPRKNRRFKIFLLSNAGRPGEGEGVRCVATFSFRFRSVPLSIPRTSCGKAESDRRRSRALCKLSKLSDALFRREISMTKSRSPLPCLRNFKLSRGNDTQERVAIAPIRSIPILFSSFLLSLHEGIFCTIVYSVNARIIIIIIIITVSRGNVFFDCHDIGMDVC